MDNAVAVRYALRRDLASLDPLAEFAEAESGDDALRLAGDWHPEAVFIGMGLANGERGLPVIDLLLRSDPARPVVVCTSLPQHHPDVGEALSLGAFAYLPKPVRRDALHHVLTQIEAATGRMRRIR